MRFFLLFSLVILSSYWVLAQAPNQLVLQVIDKSGQPVIGATLELINPKDDSSLGANAVTDIEGKATLSLPQTGPTQLRIRSIGYRQAQLFLPGGQDNQELQVTLQDAQEMLAAAVVTAVRAKASDPFAFTNVSAEKLAAANPGQDLPFLLRRTPGAVYTSDAGNGVGYTGIRIRGTDPTRINVTINGVPLNDAESQGVFWVNMPDFVSSTSSIQIQRGVGQSTYGSGAFGANINLITEAPSDRASVTGEVAGGSFGTFRSMIKANSGLIGPGLSAEARLSYISSEGFVDRARSRLGSAYLSTSWAISDQRRLQAIAWTGKEITYQSWYGIPESYAKSDSLRSFNPAGLRDDGSFYEDQVDNYRQSHAQLLYSEQLNSDWLLQLTGHYTHGRGFYEEWRNDNRFGNYFPLSPFADTSSDLVRRKWLDNNFYGGIATLSGQLSPKLTTTISAGFNRYEGGHFGTLAFVADPQLEPEAQGRYYDNEATKQDVNAFARASYTLIQNLDLYADLQLRQVNYDLDLLPGVEGARRAGDYTFFNPKLGLSARLAGLPGTSKQRPATIYASYALGQREPNRNDFQNAPLISNGAERLPVTPTAERLHDVELGLRSPASKKFSYELAGYYMLYRDQLAVTGQLNDVGEAIRINVDESYRIGVELSAAVLLASLQNGPATTTWSLDGNVALSQNRIERFDEYVDNWTTGAQEVIRREDSHLAFSPGIVANLGLIFRQVNARGSIFNAALWGSGVGLQYVDNSGSQSAELPAYGRLDLELSYAPHLKRGTPIFTLQLQNITNTHPITNGYSYRYRSPGYDPRPDDPYTQREDGDQYLLKGVYPQAGLQVLAGVRMMLGGK